MSLARRFCLHAVVLALVALSSVVAAQAPTGSVRGAVVDDSQGVVPGVTVDAVKDGKVLQTAVTDAEGRFVLTGIPAGIVTVRMSLDGFETTRLDVAVQPGVEALANGVLRVGTLTETVTVVAPAPPRVPPPPPLPPPPPPYQVRPVPQADLASVCGPAKPRNTDAVAGRLSTHYQDAGRILYRLGDELTIDAEAGRRLEVGQNYVARRYFRAAGIAGGNARGEDTAGVVQVSGVDVNGVTVVVIHACGALREGDLLMPFVPEVVRAPEPPGAPAYRDAARILFGEADQMMGAPGRMMVIDRGQAHGVRPGQRFTLFRRSFGSRSVVGEAFVLTVREDSARIMVERASGAIWFGDSAAPQEPSRRIAVRAD